MTLDSTYLLINELPPTHNGDTLQIGAIQPRSVVAGPGERAVIWVAGCLRRCPQCIKPELLSFASGTAISVTEVANRILQIPALTGVTYSGGEPFEQSLALANLSRLLRARGMTILAYSGYTLEALLDQPNRFGPLLEQVDWLIDGEYRPDQEGPFQWFGSANQRILRRSQSGEFVEFRTAQVREMQISMTDDELRLTGFPSAVVERSLAEALARRGILIRPTSSLDSL